MIDTGVDVTRRWTLRLVAGLAAGAVALSGCSERQEANDTLPGADAEPSASEPELPPLGPPDLPMPAAARTPDAAGAEAFVRYYIDLINRTSTVMDAALLREFSDRCDGCNRIAAHTEEDARAGYDYEGGEITITEISQPLMKGATAEMAIRMDQARFRVVDASGSPVDGGSEPYSALLGGAALVWSPDRSTWLITSLTFG
ncbi:hypothetical protein E4P41_11045 [Geodermatophilus sp. DF01-2]|uniref:DUF6318 family protein n=1 Tax=Geodermatophilus sp. DF01-2 TaxID=2559610 RepID=UPI0010738148|nr:DUF6318 family protein [Geodermatophilus sp. DF01_2]TFV59850.1 hypothetical protein E4P41_11045 [Geodermatophilus sp. DF01_2]